MDYFQINIKNITAVSKTKETVGLPVVTLKKVIKLFYRYKYLFKIRRMNRLDALKIVKWNFEKHISNTNSEEKNCFAQFKKNAKKILKLFRQKKIVERIQSLKIKLKYLQQDFLNIWKLYLKDNSEKNYTSEHTEDLIRTNSRAEIYQVYIPAVSLPAGGHSLA